MNSEHTNRIEFENKPVSPKLKIAMLWASLMFVYIYTDYFHLYMPESINDIVRGRVFVFDINPAFIFAGLVSVAIPAMMISLSVFVSANFNRWINIITAAVYIPYTLYNLVGEAWLHMYFAAAVETVALLMVIACAWAWPRVEMQET